MLRPVVQLRNIFGFSDTTDLYGCSDIVQCSRPFNLVGVPPELRGHVFRDRLRRLEEPAPILTRSHGRELRMEDRQEARRDFELVTLRREEAMEEQGSRC